MNKAFIGLGSNLQNPREQLSKALEELACLPQTYLLQASSFYWTQPLGPQDQPHFLNGVAAIKTSLSAQDLLFHLLGIEQKHQRIRNIYYGPRTLDLDLLLYEQEQINLAYLTVPHPKIKERAFVLYPLAEIAPDLIFPDGEKVGDLLETVEWEGVKAE